MADADTPRERRSGKDRRAEDETRTEALDRFSTALESLSRSQVEFAGVVQKVLEGENQRQKRFGYILISQGVSLVILITMVVGAPFLYQVVQDTNENSSILRECTTPSSPEERHECFERSQASTTTAITAINVNSVVAAECAVDFLESGVRVSDCVQERLPAALNDAGISQEQQNQDD